MAIIKIKKIVEVNAVKMIVSANVRYWEDASVDGVEDTEGKSIPCRVGDCWCPEIDIETGTITNWTKGVSASIHYKVCDCCTIKIIGDDNFVHLTSDGYVPRILCPKENGYGDYIIMDVTSSGDIIDWVCDLDEFLDNDED